MNVYNVLRYTHDRLYLVRGVEGTMLPVREVDITGYRSRYSKRAFN